MGDQWEWKLTIETGRKGGPGSGHHGHAGRPGKRGGSAPGKGGGNYGTGSVPEKGYGPGQDNAYKAEAWLTSGIPRRNWKGASDYTRGQVKARIVDAIAKRTGIDPQDVNTFIRQWSQSSNDDDMRSLAIQRDAAKEFGMPLSDFTKQSIDLNQSTVLADVLGMTKWNPSISEAEIRRRMPDRFPLMESPEQRKLLRAMYEHTQEQLKSAGIIGKVTLYRGVKYGSGDVAELEGRDSVRIKGNALESWSLDPYVAEQFAMPGEDDWDAGGVVFAMDVPVTAIMGSAKTGFGCLTEAEFVVLGIEGEAMVRSTYIQEGEGWFD